MPTEAEIAWAAGLFEGEGCASINHGKYASPALSVWSSDLDVLERFQKIVGCGAVRSRGPGAQNFSKPHKTKQMWNWQTGKKADVARIIEAFLPWLGERRRARVLEVLPFTEGPVANTEKTHCPKGHPYDEENTYHPPSYPKGRKCRTCQRERQRVVVR